MTPVEAQALLDKIKGTDASVLQAHMDWKDVVEALETIASMGYVYDYEVVFDEEWTPIGHCFPTLEYARQFVAGRERTSPARIIRRLFGGSEVVE